MVLCKLRGVNLKLNPNKCSFAAKSITFLGHVVSKDGTKPDPGKIEAVLHFPQPRTVTNVKSFLGLTSYYRKYVKGYACLAAPLFELTRKDVDFVWNMGCQQAFQALRTVLIRAPILIRPDFKKAFCLDVDWSPKGVGAILSQKEGTLEKVVAYASKSLSIAQKKFHPMEGECYHSYGELCILDNTCTGVILLCALITNHSSGWQLCQTHMVGEADGSTYCRILAFRSCTVRA